GALEPDVGRLDPGARVRAAVDVDRDRDVEIRQALLELADQVGGAGLGLDDGQLAELDAGAGHRVPAESAGPGRQAGRLQLGHQFFGAPGRDVEDDHLLLGRRADPAAAVPAGEVGDDIERVGRDAAHGGGEADVAVPVALGVDAHVVPDPAAGG